MFEAEMPFEEAEKRVLGNDLALVILFKEIHKLRERVAQLEKGPMRYSGTPL